jgi:ABC-type uncharacterized transport system permease subunit
MCIIESNIIFQIYVFIEIVKFFYNESIWQSVHISVISELFYCFILPTAHAYYVGPAFFINIIPAP